MKEAYFFDMDGILFDSMPHHAIAWEKVMEQHNLPFSAHDCYVNEGRTGESVIREAMWKARGRDATPDEISSIYAEKSAYFTMLEQKAGGTPTIPGVAEVLQYIDTCGNDIWVVTGSGMRSLKWLGKNIKYPTISQENGVQGRVIIQFVVNRDGSIVDAQVARGVDPYLDKEALRVVGLMPKWKPGKQRGKEVRVKYTLPVMFRLQ